MTWLGLIEQTALGGKVNLATLASSFLGEQPLVALDVEREANR
jgi:hypothetical protein